MSADDMKARPQVMMRSIDLVGGTSSQLEGALRAIAAHYDAEFLAFDLAGDGTSYSPLLAMPDKQSNDELQMHHLEDKLARETEARILLEAERDEALREIVRLKDHIARLAGSSGEKTFDEVADDITRIFSGDA